MGITTRRFDGAKLRSARKEKGLSQGRLGGLIGAHVTSVSDWERGDNAPSGRHVAALARELGVSAEHFYADPDDAEAASMASATAEFTQALGAMFTAAVAEAVAKALR